MAMTDAETWAAAIAACSLLVSMYAVIEGRRTRTTADEAHRLAIASGRKADLDVIAKLATDVVSRTD